MVEACYARPASASRTIIGAIRYLYVLCSRESARRCQMSLKIVVIGGVFLAASTCFAGAITFDDIAVPIGYNSYVAVPNGYQSFNWNNFDAFYAPGTPNTGYAAGMVSPSNVAFNRSGDPASFSSATQFMFTSAYFTAAWNDGLNITIEGLNGATVVDSTTIVVSATVPTLETFDWTGLTAVDFTSFGGTLHPGYKGKSGTEFILDNLTINAAPEPSALVLVGIGIGLGRLALLCNRRFGR